MRRSARSPQAAISALSAIIANRSPVVFITGAGISSSSGIPTFRGGGDSAVWDEKTLRYATFASFSNDPLHWYNAFWLSGVIPWHAFYTAAPNAAHLAIATLASRFDVRVVTQNIDLLHRKGAGKVAEEKLILAHGRGEVYQCDRYGHGCIGSRERDVDLWKCAAVNASRPDAGTEEDYDEELWSRYEGWVNEAAAIVFVGSSNAVGLTTDALKVARRRSLPVFSFNIYRSCMDSAPNSVPVYHVIGPAEDTIPLLLDSVLKAEVKS